MIISDREDPFMWSHFVCALSFLTILRIPGSSDQAVSGLDLARGFSFFPLVGLILGACSFALAYTISPFMPSLFLAVAIIATQAMLTRALHLDGLADFIDGVGGGYTPQRRLEIMKDSRTGAFGALALILAVFLKAAAIETLILHSQWPPLLLVPVLSRFAMVLAAYRSPYARAEGGLGKPFLEHMTSREVMIASAFSLAIALLLAPFSAPSHIAIMLVVVGLLRHLSHKWLGGITGDVLGAVNEIVEVCLFALAAGLAPH